MQLQQSPIPNERPELCWRTISVPANQPLKAWTAGQPQCFTVHQLERITKPCVAVASNGYLTCEWCGVWRTTWKAYYPLFTCARPMKQVVVMLSKSAMKAAPSLPTHTPVIVKNPGTKDHRPVTIARDDEQREKGWEEVIARRKPVDIIPYLLNLWGHEKLATWAGYPLRAGEGGLKCGELRPTSLPALMETVPANPPAAATPPHEDTTNASEVPSGVTPRTGTRKRKSAG